MGTQSTCGLEDEIRALITGSHGFVGRHFTKNLLSSGWSVVGVDNLVAGKYIFPSWAYRQDFKEIIQDCRSYFKESQTESFDLVVHLAAVVGGRGAIEGDSFGVTECLQIDSSFWSWAIRARPSKIVSFSSSAAYPIRLQTGETKHVLREKDLDLERAFYLPDETYGWAKLTNEYLGKMASKKYDLDVACYRPFSGYGWDQSEDYPFNAILTRALNRDLDEQGNFYVWGDGKQVRDFIHIDDVIRCVLETKDLLRDGSAVNIATGIGTSFLELAQMACDLVGIDVPIVGKSNKPSGVRFRVGSTNLASSLGFESKIGLVEGVETSIKELLSR